MTANGKAMMTRTVSSIGAALLLLCSATAAHSGGWGVEGVWATTEASCPAPGSEGNYESYKITREWMGYTAGEGLGCSFEGGDTSDPDHWTMKGRCGVEGEEDRPLSQVDIRISGGILRIDIAGKGDDGSLRFILRCP